ncbi:integral membrane sensor hybrid histidine kinase [Marinobacter santoriniensis NKSG1]|uniref:histidine kinase n=1 Tax=Marinobacter santoriniensis NKSG1 TaxID=1288826 RepID=M7CPU0_9GAMM|nr:response regulator [Marinobacter santoriniensis]EMP55686.1 integral membrane sensor hybrid histidine kinase [Marinobacter santoriniensis NKSG1]
MSNWFRKRLSYRLTRDTVLVAMAVGLVLNLIQITLDYFSARESMESEVHALMEISQSPASQIAYNIDVRLAEELLDGLLRHPATIDARIIDSEGLTMAAASQSSLSSPYRWLSDLLFGESLTFSSELHVKQLQDLPLGRLVVTIDTYHYGLQFLERSLYTLVSGLLKSLALSAALLAIFYVVLTRPMLNVIGALSRVTANSPEKIRPPVPAGHGEDEIGTMVGIINQHLEAIDSSLVQLRSAESAMKNYSSQLEQEVADRTREISEKNSALQRGNNALVRAKEDAVRRAKGRANFLASMSHEIRTPLNGLLGMLGLAVEGELDPVQRNRIEIALNAGESLMNLLNDILDISKVEAGKLDLENIPFSLRHLIEECATLHAQQARRKGIDLVTEVDPDLPEQFLGDPTRTRQILNNLISNAIKFTDKGLVRVKASYSAGSFRLEVIDTGIGMSKQGLHRIFSAFSQADSDTTRRYGGTGLGLTLCRQLVERMHGQILVDSSEGTGTHFTVTLPFPIHETEEASILSDNAMEALRDIGVALAIPTSYPHRPALESQLRAWHIPVRGASRHPEGILLIAIDGDDAESLAYADNWSGTGVVIAGTQINQVSRHTRYPLLSLPMRRDELFQRLCQAAGIEIGESPGHQADTPPLQPVRPLSILLVEDNEVNQMVATSLLKKLGHRVDQAENGERALDALESHRYDLVLMDCQMPVMDGYETTRRIRQNPAYDGLPIIAVTANVMQGDRESCIAAGMNDYITKPYNREQLRAMIERWAPNPPPASPEQP